MGKLVHEITLCNASPQENLSVRAHAKCLLKSVAFNTSCIGFEIRRALFRHPHDLFNITVPISPHAMHLLSSCGVRNGKHRLGFDHELYHPSHYHLGAAELELRVYQKSQTSLRRLLRSMKATTGIAVHTGPNPYPY